MLCVRLLHQPLTLVNASSDDSDHFCRYYWVSFAGVVNGDTDIALRRRLAATESSLSQWFGINVFHKKSNKPQKQRRRRNTGRLNHIYTRSLTVNTLFPLLLTSCTYSLSLSPPSHHAPRGLQYIIDKGKRLERNNNRVGSHTQTHSVTRTRVLTASVMSWPQDAESVKCHFLQY
ncbi:hypothetical protein JOB18_047103 [Solea senegalensis]|uniref:Uncharacterized protein n=1 Tax=Solea senegalensis TaxID=28829 RepID=A0AAV6SLH3_SOLSE|nr:hypothetical protein JOB18_047103 [Solea senegalensis]